MAKLFGCPINVELEEEDGDGSSIAVDFFRSGNQPDGEATSFSAGLPPVNQRETNIPYFRFLDSNSDSESVSMESESDLRRSFVDFFDDSYVASNQRQSSTSWDFDIWGTQDMEVEIELGLQIGSGPGSDDSGGLGLQFTEIDTGRVEVDTGRVEVDTGVTFETMIDNLECLEANLLLEEESDGWFDTGRVEVDTGRVEVDRGVSYETMIDNMEPLETNLLPEEESDVMEYNQEDEPTDQELDDGFLFDVSFEEPVEDTTAGTEFFWDSFLLPSVGENHGDYEDVLARTFEESGVNGSPPASKRVVDELPDVGIITSEELSIGCAICKDEIVAEEKAKRLPCKHYYHKECIVPWLGIRNTCPVCRYELPTDDIEYEGNKSSQRRTRLDEVNVAFWF